MLSAAAPLDRLALRRDAPGIDDIDWAAPIDRTRWYFCETLTPLYYTPIYQELSPLHRRRYNQLMGMLTSEVISTLETGLLSAALKAVEESGERDEGLRTAVTQFRDDERRHAEAWTRLNRLSEPAWYAGARSRLLKIPAPAALLSCLISRYPIAFPVIFWLQLVQEERSVEFSRRCLRVPADRIEPRYAAVYRAHLRDELRHVQIDRHLIDRFYAGRSPAVRRFTARAFRWIIGSLLLTPVNSSARVVGVLAAEHPELQPFVPRMLNELRALGQDDRYHDMMYSRRTTPVTFTLFDRFPEFWQMQRVLRAYRPPASPAGPGLPS